MQASVKAEAHFKADQVGRIDVRGERRPSRRQPPRAGKAEKVRHQCSWFESEHSHLVALSLPALQVEVKTELA